MKHKICCVFTVSIEYMSKNDHIQFYLCFTQRPSFLKSGLNNINRTWLLCRCCLVLTWTTCSLSGRSFLHFSTRWDGNPHWWPWEERGWAHDSGWHGGEGHFEVTAGPQLVCQMSFYHLISKNWGLPHACQQRCHFSGDYKAPHINETCLHQFITLHFCQIYVFSNHTANKSVSMLTRTTG